MRGILVTEKGKREAALKALREEIHGGQILGIGTGSTVAFFIEELGRVAQRKTLKVICVPSSLHTQSLCTQAGLTLTTLEAHPTLDLTIDGADEIDLELNLIKGGGAALTREKILAAASRRLAIIADESKLVKRLGEKHPVPVEVIPFALGFVENRLKKLKPSSMRLRMSGLGKDGPIITDNGNVIIDVFLRRISDPSQTSAELKSIPGVVENGIFAEMADVAYLGGARDVKVLR